MRLVTTVNFGRLHIFDSRERSTTRFRIPSCASIATMDPLAWSCESPFVKIGQLILNQLPAQVAP